jgi:alpha-galactosidase
VTVSLRFETEQLTSLILAVAVLMVSALVSNSKLVSLSAPPQDGDTLRASDPPANGVWVDTLDLDKIGPGWLRARAGKSVRNNPLSLNGIVYQHGIGSIAMSEITVDLKGEAVRFLSVVGIDDSRRTGVGSVNFEVWLDNIKVADSGILRSSQPPKLMSVDLTGARRMTLFIDNGGDGGRDDDADWAGAVIVLASGAKSQPETFKLPVEPPPPIASRISAKPAIHGPRITGATPGRPFLFLIPATGMGPLTFSATNLPQGLLLDKNTGIISGALKRATTTVTLLTVRGPKGSSSRDLTIVGGTNKLAQTPPMGWNSWNVWGQAVDAEKVRQAADAMVKSGLAAHGFQYVNIDDTWEGKRDARGELQTNEKFGDMKELAAYVHSKGLRIGIYSSPGPLTCAKFAASHNHEEQDARTFARWGIDYLKYDWCSYGQIAKDRSLPELKQPYNVMRTALDKVDRDIVYSLCQYGMGSVWEWGAEVGGNLWRTTGDITDTWVSLSNIGFSENGHEKFASPGHWNDPDMLVVGKVGWGPDIHPTRLTPNEQITHITLWALVSAPLLIGCDMSAMDKFTLDLLSNDEVIEVNQDPLGKPAGRRAQEGRVEIWARPLGDGTLAVGLFNRGQEAKKVTARWSDLGLAGRQPVRDLWLQQDLGVFADSFSTMVPQHGAVLIKVGKQGRGSL